jgi:hypothetical protein
MAGAHPPWWSFNIVQPLIQLAAAEITPGEVPHEFSTALQNRLRGQRIGESGTWTGLNHTNGIRQIPYRMLT